MTSCFDGDDLVGDDNPLNKSEQEALRKKFNELCAVGATADENKKIFLKEFESQEIAHFAASIYDACRDSSNSTASPTFLHFQKFAINISRSTSSNIIRYIWSLVFNAKDVSLLPGEGVHSRTSTFLRLMLECSLCEKHHLAVTADRLTEHMEYVTSSAGNRNKHRDNGGVISLGTEDTSVDSETELAAFIDWVNEYAPHTAKVFVSTHAPYLKYHKLVFYVFFCRFSSLFVFLTVYLRKTCRR